MQIPTLVRGALVAVLALFLSVPADAQGGGGGGRGGRRGGAPGGAPRSPGGGANRNNPNDTAEGDEAKTPGGMEVGSLETLRKLEISWRSMRISPPKAGEQAAKDPLQAALDQSSLPPESRTPRPTVVWFAAAEPDSALEHTLFGSDDLRIAAQYFDCVKVVLADVEPADLRAKYAKTTPAFIFFDAGAKETGRLPSPAGPKPILAQMAKAANPHFKKSLTDLVAKYLDFLKKFDKAAARYDAAVKDLKEAEAKDAEASTERTKAEVKKAFDAVNKIKLERERLGDEEKTLLKAELKGDPYAKPAAKPEAKPEAKEPTKS
jgi:hypothetical protein